MGSEMCIRDRMSTVDTLINATAAVFINDVYRPAKKFLSKSASDTPDERRELRAARYTSIAITVLGVLAVLAFKNFPTVYEAHGYFHSTLTPPLVVAIFLGVFWKRFTPAAVITTFIGGVALMILGARYPEVLIAPFDHGIAMDPDRPYSYIRALYNTLVCVGVGVTVTFLSSFLERTAKQFSKQMIQGISVLTGVLFFAVLFNLFGLIVSVVFIIITLFFTALSTSYFIPFDEKKMIGYTSWTLKEAKEDFKGSDPNTIPGQIIPVSWEIRDMQQDEIRFSNSDMEKMSANPGDLVYLCDARGWLGGLKSIHSIYGEPHEDEGVVYMNEENAARGIFEEGKTLKAEKEM